MKKMILMALICGLSGVVQAETKVGLVDMQKAIQTSSAGKKAKAELETELEKKKKEIKKKEDDLKKMGEDLERKKAVLSEEVFGKKQAEFQDEMMKYRDNATKTQMELQKKERDLTVPIVDKMKKVIAKISKDKGLTLVLENSPMVLFSEPALDITDDVIKAFEKEK